MIVRFSRFMILILAILVMSVYLPDFYWLLFSSKVNVPNVNYSIIDSSFVISRYVDGQFVYSNTKLDTFSRSDMEEKLPLYYYMQLVSDNKLPEEIHGVPIEINTIKRNRIFMRIRPNQLDMPQIQLFPLFESQSDRVNLEMPTDYFRIVERMEFIESSTNKINEEKSSLFTEALKEAGFSFPARKIFGNPTTRKAFDEGYFVVDKVGKLFHLKMVKGQPYVRDTKFPEDIEIHHIIVNENSLNEFYGLLISKSSDLIILQTDNYRAVTFPLDGKYDYRKDNLVFSTDIFLRNATIRQAGGIKVITADTDYQLIDNYEENWPRRRDTKAGIAAAYIFPFSLSLINSNSLYIDFYFEKYAFSSLFLNILLALGLGYWIFRRQKNLNGQWGNLLLVVLGGIYGFIAVLAFTERIKMPKAL
jgi:hypothetical protein